VSPTDPLAATAIARRLACPGRVITVLEGDSLVNDANALVAYRIAVAAVAGGDLWPGRPACGTWLAQPAGWRSAWRSAG
jgi:monovalent cation/hydrogen antiporter